MPEAALARNVGCDAGASYPTYSDLLRLLRPTAN
ncbi:hypothetical protein HUSEC41_12812 [Escherichia coli O104:H4 str. 01-09591]|nr:hypothetical protein HUSEC41_12812 [Escherichia coli O104:H4 str. 01-09591]